jgi:manganese oxidase
MLRKSAFWVVLLLMALMATSCSSGGGKTTVPAASPAKSGGQTVSATSTPASAGEKTAVPTETPASSGAEAQIAMKGFKFVPAELTVKAGTTVTWTNQDGAGHTITSGTRGSPTALFDSGNVAGGKTFSFTFKDPGVYPYFCALHQGMDGQITVQ